MRSVAAWVAEWIVRAAKARTCHLRVGAVPQVATRRSIRKQGQRAAPGTAFNLQHAQLGQGPLPA